MLSSVFKSQKALQVNIMIMRPFILMHQFAPESTELRARIERLEDEMQTRFADISKALNYLLEPAQAGEETDCV